MRAWLVVIGVCAACAAVPAQPVAESCEPVGKPQALEEVREASGVAVGQVGLWTINDSGAPLLFRLDTAGNVSPVTVAGAAIVDWEDLAIGRCPAGDCLYIADIGDNRELRDRVTLYRVPEPVSGRAATEPAEIFHLTYPDQPHDAETLLAVPHGAEPELFIVTKDSSPRVYRPAGPLKPGQVSLLAFVRSLNVRARLTGGAASSDGRWIALRSNRTLFIYQTQDFAAGRDPVAIDLAGLNEPQGEGIAFGRDNTLYLVSESGGDGGAGLLTPIRCAFIR